MDKVVILGTFFEVCFRKQLQNRGHRKYLPGETSVHEIKSLASLILWTSTPESKRMTNLHYRYHHMIMDCHAPETFAKDADSTSYAPRMGQARRNKNIAI